MPKPKKSNLAQNLKSLRERKSISQAALAREVDSTRSRIASYELGKAEPNAMTLARLARYFQVNLQTLITGDFVNAPARSPSYPHHEKSVVGQDKMLSWYLRKHRQHRRLIEDIKHLYRYRQLTHDDGERSYQAMADDFEKLLFSAQTLLDLNDDLIKELSRKPS